MRHGDAGRPLAPFSLSIIHPFDRSFLLLCVCVCCTVCNTAALHEAIQRASGEEIIIPFGVGIAGTVAETKSTIKIQNAYADPRFNSEIDQKTGYKTNNMLSMAISNYEGDVIGVAQIINKTNGKCAHGVP